MELLFRYCKEHKKLIISYIIGFGMLFFIFSLYDNEIEGVLYGMFLTFLFLIFVGGYDFIQYKKKHDALQNYKEEIRYSMEHFIEDSTLIGQDYQQLLHLLQEEKQEQIAKYEREKKELEDYFSLWIHQMKLPIASVKLLTDTEEVLDKKLVKAELFRIEQYSEMALAYIRMNSVVTDYVIREYDLDCMIRQAIRRFASEFIRKKIKMEFEETNQKLITDEKWFVFVLEQLLSNALKYTKEGSIHIYLQEENVLVIEDTGIGMEESDCYRVFEKGYTGFNGRYDKKASGIGLYLCKTIMEKLNHNIWITSKKGIGTKVMLSWKKG